MVVTFQYGGLHHLDLYCTLIIKACLKSTIHFDCKYLQLRIACIISLVFIVLNVRDGTESTYPFIVFLSIVSIFCDSLHTVHGFNYGFLGGSDSLTTLN